MIKIYFYFLFLFLFLFLFFALHTDKFVCNYIRILHTDFSVCNYIRILDPYVKLTYNNFTYGFLSVCKPVLHTDFGPYIRILAVCNSNFSCSGFVTSSERLLGMKSRPIGLG